MNFKTTSILLTAVVMSATLLTSCAQKPAANAQEAIQQSQSKGTPQQQADYLVGQANAFLSSKNYDQAMAVANHVLTNLDQNSQAAKNILMKAKETILQYIFFLCALVSVIAVKCTP